VKQLSKILRNITVIRNKIPSTRDVIYDYYIYKNIRKQRNNIQNNIQIGLLLMNVSDNFFTSSKLYTMLIGGFGTFVEIILFYVSSK